MPEPNYAAIVAAAAGVTPEPSPDYQAVARSAVGEPDYGAIAAVAAQATQSPRREIPVPPVMVPSEKENRGKLFSGGFVRDVFDVISVGQYAVAGLAAGKSLRQAVNERSSWEEVLQQMGMAEGTTRTAMGLGADILLDPAWFVAPAKVLGLAKRAGSVAKAIEGTKRFATGTAAGAWIAKNFGEYGKNVPKDVLDAVDAMRQKELFYTKKGFDIAKRIFKMDKGFRNLVSEAVEAGDTLSRKAIYEAVRTTGRNADDLSKVVDDVVGLHDEIGLLEVKSGALKPERFAAWRGRYLRRIYEKYELKSKPLFDLFIHNVEEVNPKLAAEVRGRAETRFAKTGKYGISRAALETRMNLPKQIREELGEITDAAARVAKGVAIGARAAAQGELMAIVATKYGKPAAEVGLKQIPDTARWGLLGGKWIPEPIHNMLTQTLRQPGKWEQGIRHVNAWWKAGKTVLSPSSHATQWFGNALMIPLFSNIPLFRLPDLFTTGGMAVFGKGNPKLVQAVNAIKAEKANFAHAEIERILTAAMGGGDSLFAKAKTLASQGVAGAATLYQTADVWGKAAVAAHGIENGMDVAEAVRFADSVLFNYAKVPRAVEWMRSNGVVPFASFAYFSTRGTAKAMWTRPARLTQVSKTLSAIEADVPNRDEQKRIFPDWMKRFGQVLTPFKDKYGRSMVLDLTYLLPFQQAFGAVDEPGRVVTSLASPLTFAYDLLTNKSTFTGQPIVKPADLVGKVENKSRRAISAYVDYIYKFALPKWAPSLFPWNERQLTGGGTMWQKFENVMKGKADRTDKVPDWRYLAMGEVLGLKTRPFDVPKEARARVREYKYTRGLVIGKMKEMAGRKDLTWDEKHAMVEDLTEDLRALDAGFLLEE